MVSNALAPRALPSESAWAAVALVGGGLLLHLSLPVATADPFPM